MLVVAVGVHSEWGRTMALVATEAQPTPLQVLLGLQHMHLSSMPSPMALLISVALPYIFSCDGAAFAIG